MTYSISFERMDEIRPLLEKHYRLGAGYFASYYNKETERIVMDFPCSYDELVCRIKEGGITYHSGDEQISALADNPLFVTALWVMMSVCQRPQQDDSIPGTFAEYWKRETEGIKDDGSDEYHTDMSDIQNECIEEFFETRLRKDLLKLYIYHKEKPYDIPTGLTIKYGKGKSIKLENAYNWFERVLLAEHFKKFLPEIKSLEDAKKALDRLNHTSDRLSRPLMYHFIYGTYSMIADMTGVTKVTDAVCYLLIRLMTEMDYPTEYLYKDKPRGMDISYIRAMISRLRKNPKRVQFNIYIPLRISEIEDELRRTGRILYTKTGLYKAAIDETTVMSNSDKSENITQ